MAESKWYAIKTVYRTSARGRKTRTDAHYDAEATLVEERVVLTRAGSFKAAIAKGEREAREYARNTTYRNPYGQPVKTHYLEACDAFELSEQPGPGVEVYSRTEVTDSAQSDGAVVERHVGPDEVRGGDKRRRKFLIGAP